MLDLGWTELLVIGVVALIVVGPKDLPVLFQQVGRFVGKARGMAREFSRAMTQAADEAGVGDATAQLRAAADGLHKAARPMQGAADALKAHARAATKWDPQSHTGQLARERAEAARKIHEASAQAALKRQAEQAPPPKVPPPAKEAVGEGRPAERAETIEAQQATKAASVEPAGEPAGRTQAAS